MSEQMMLCEECDDPYPMSDLNLCTECGLWLCDVCELDHDNCPRGGDDGWDDDGWDDDGWDDDGWDSPRSRYEQEAALAAWNARVAEWNAAARSQP